MVVHSNDSSLTLVDLVKWLVFNFDLWLAFYKYEPHPARFFVIFWAIFVFAMLENIIKVCIENRWWFELYTGKSLLLVGAHMPFVVSKHVCTFYSMLIASSNKSCQRCWAKKTAKTNVHVHSHLLTHIMYIKKFQAHVNILWPYWLLVISIIGYLDAFFGKLLGQWHNRVQLYNFTKVCWSCVSPPPIFFALNLHCTTTKVC